MDALHGAKVFHHGYKRSGPFHKRFKLISNPNFVNKEIHVVPALKWSNQSIIMHIPRAIYHFSDVIMCAMASQITSLTIVYSTVYSGADQRKHQSSALLAFVRGIHRWPVNFPTQKASNAENVSIWWRHRVKWFPLISMGPWTNMD